MAERILKRMKFPNAFVADTVTLVREHDRKLYADRPLLRRFLHQLGEDLLRKLLEVQWADASGKYEKYLAATEERLTAVRNLMNQILLEGDCCQLSSLAVNGNDLRAAGIPEGRQVGELLQTLLEEVMEDRLPNEKNRLLEEARAYAKKNGTAASDQTEQS